MNGVSRMEPSLVGFPAIGRCRVMGVLNVTPDSFSDGGRYFDHDRAVEHGLALFEAGVDIVDVGGESTRPGALLVDPEEELRRVAEKVVADFPVTALAAVHRVGELRVTDTAVIVAVSCAHRGEAFEASRRLIDDLKHTVPIWKHQRFADGGEEWVASC